MSAILSLYSLFVDSIEEKGLMYVEEYVSLKFLSYTVFCLCNTFYSA